MHRGAALHSPISSVAEDHIRSRVKSWILQLQLCDLVSPQMKLVRIVCALEQLGYVDMSRDIDRIAHEACIERGAYPSPLNYYHFPKSCCTLVSTHIPSLTITYADCRIM